MAQYTLKPTDEFLESIKKYKNLKAEIEKKLLKIKEHPELGKPLKYATPGFKSETVMDNFRILYFVDEQTKSIELIAFGNRDDFYKRYKS